MSPGLEVNRAPLYRIPLPQLLFRVVSVPAIGALRSGLAALIDHNSLRTDITGQRVAGNPEVRLTVGEVATDIEEMLGILRDGIRQLSAAARSEEHTSELQSLMRISYAVFCLKKKQP